MARISGVDLPREKRVEIGLTYIYGIGRTSSNRILAEAGVNPDTRVKDLTDDEVKKIAAVVADTQVVEGDLRREIAMNIKRLQEIGCYRGIRHRKACQFVVRRLRQTQEHAKVLEENSSKQEEISNLSRITLHVLKTGDKDSSN